MRRFWVVHAVIPFAVWGALVLLFELTSLDLQATDRVYDFIAHRWPHQHEWVYASLLHTGGKWLVVGIAAAAFVGWLASFRLPSLRPWRRAALYLVVCVALSALVIGALKATTNRFTPWDMDRYGGRVPYTTLFSGTPPAFTGGRGFPAAHAASALSLCALYFIAYDRRTPRAWLWLLPSVLLGGLFAYTQHVRGAHFLSHNVWSAGICWLVSLVVYPAFRAGPPLTSLRRPRRTIPVWRGPRRRE